MSEKAERRQAKPAPAKAPAKATRPGAARPRSSAEAILMRNDFYSDAVPKVVWAAGICVLAAIISVGSMIYAANKRERNVYFAVDEGNRIVQLQPLSRPNQSNAVVGQWLTESLVKTFDFHYSNFGPRLNEAADTFFTKDGANSLITAIQESNLLDQVRQLEGKVALNLRTPILVKEGSLGAGQFYAWVYTVDGTMTVFTKSQRYDLPVEFEVTVSRRDELEYPKGIGIARVFMEISRNANR